MSEHPNRQVTVRRGWTKANPGAQKPRGVLCNPDRHRVKGESPSVYSGCAESKEAEEGDLQRLKSLREGCDHKYPWTGWVVFPE